MRTRQRLLIIAEPGVLAKGFGAVAALCRYHRFHFDRAAGLDDDPLHSFQIGLKAFLRE